MQANFPYGVKLVLLRAGAHSYGKVMEKAKQIALKRKLIIYALIHLT